MALVLPKTREVEGVMDKEKRIAVEAATFRRLVNHLDNHKEVQNIDLMNLADFCRNCLSKWYRAEAEILGHEVSYDEAREIIYGMPYTEWKSQYQREATPQKLEKFRKGSS